MIRLAALLCLFAGSAAADYCDDWREFRDGAQSSTTSEFWEFALVKYCAGGISGQCSPPAINRAGSSVACRQPETDIMGASLTPDVLEARIEDWRSRCDEEYVSWDAATGTVVRRVSRGRRVLCPLPL